MYYLDEAVTGDVEYCYYVTQVDMEGADESDSSNHACATPVAPVVLPVPTDLVADADEYNVMVNWVAPDLTDYDPIGGNPPVIGEKIDDVSTYIAYDPADYPLPNRQGGDTVDDATSVDGLPYYNTGTTIGYTDDYDEVCPYTGSTSPDVVYSFTPDADVIIDVSLCGEGTLYDTKVYVYENEAGALASTLAGIDACNDDECANSTTNWLSYLPGVICTAGNTYYIVIDGYGGDAGDYELEIVDGTPSPVMGYNVYRDGAAVGYNEGYSNTGWGEFMPTEGTYEYYVTAMYEVFGESDPSNTDTATVSAPAPTCEAPQNLMAESLGNDVSLSWDAPAGGPGWIGYYNGEFNGGIGTGGEAIFECAAMFGPEQLSAYNGMLLTKVAFIPNEVAATYTVMIYDVSSGTPVAVDSSESFDGADLVMGEFLEVELANAITVDWTEALMFGFKVNTTTGYPGGIDTGPGVAGYGDFMFYGGAWVSIVNDFGLDYNWAIEGFVDYGTGGRSLTSMEPINVDYPSSNGEVSAHTLATPVIVNTTSERTMTNYIVYRDDAEIATTEASDAMYYDEDVAFGTHTYFVTALAGGVLVPVVGLEGVLVDLLPHAPTRSEAHLRGRRHRVANLVAPVAPYGLRSARKVPLEGAALHGVDGDLQPAMLRLAGHLLLGGVPRPQRHRDELPDEALLDAVPVEPRLFRGDHVVLPRLRESEAPPLTGDRVHLTGGDPYGEGVVRSALLDESAGEVQPEGFGLVHGQHHAAVLSPTPRNLRGEIVDVP